MSQLLVESVPAAAPAVTESPLLQAARCKAAQERAGFAGTLPPQDAWILVGQGLAVLIDVRSAEELKFVGSVPGSVHVPWASGIHLLRNPRFLRDLEKKVRHDDVIFFLCRSGKRSAIAAQEATQEGFTSAFNIQGGFEGERNDRQQRGELGGWRWYGLPWIQD